MKKVLTMGNENSKTIMQSKDEYLRYHKIKNSSEQTIGYYNLCINLFIRFLGIGETLIKDVKLNVVEDYILYMREQNTMNAVSINSQLRGIRAFLYYYMERGYINEYKIKLIKTDQEIKEAYTEKELEILLKKPDIKKCSFTEYRNWVIVNFLCATGCRKRTLANIRIEDLDFNNNLIKLRVTKSRKEQIIPMSNVLNNVLKEYLNYRKSEKQDDYLFCNQYGEQLSKDSLTSCIYDYNKKRGVSKTSIHLFRHTFAKNWILNGGDIFRLQNVLGHSDISIVRKYVNIYGMELQKDFDKFCLIDKINLAKNKEKIRIG